MKGKTKQTKLCEGSHSSPATSRPMPSLSQQWRHWKNCHLTVLQLSMMLCGGECVFGEFESNLLCPLTTSWQCYSSHITSTSAVALGAIIPVGSLSAPGLLLSNDGCHQSASKISKLQASYWDPCIYRTWNRRQWGGLRHQEVAVMTLSRHWKDWFPCFLCSTVTVCTACMPQSPCIRDCCPIRLLQVSQGDDYLKGLQSPFNENILWWQVFLHKRVFHNHPVCLVTCSLIFLGLCNYLDFLPIFHTSPCLYSLLPSVSTALDLLLFYSSFKDKPSHHSFRFLA